MQLKMKIVATTILWTIAIATAIGRSTTGEEALGVWAILAAAAAAVLSAALAGDYIAAEATHHILKRITEERNATVDRATRAIGESMKSSEDRAVSRIAAANEAALRRVAEEISEAVGGDRPTPFRRN